MLTQVGLRALDCFSLMLRRRVLVLSLGSRGPGGDQKSLHLCPQAFAKRSQAFASVAHF